VRTCLSRRRALISSRSSPKGWKRPFDDPIPLPRGGQLVTLEDAGTYVTRLPRAEHTAPEWQAAMEALILVATVGGPGIMAQTPQDIGPARPKSPAKETTMRRPTKSPFHRPAMQTLERLHAELGGY